MGIYGLFSGENTRNTKWFERIEWNDSAEFEMHGWWWLIGNIRNSNR